MIKKTLFLAVVLILRATAGWADVAAANDQKQGSITHKVECELTASISCAKGYCTYIVHQWGKLFEFDFDRKTYVNTSIDAQPHPMRL